MIASAVSRDVAGFDLKLAYEAVKKNADVPPVNDVTTQFVFALPPLLSLPLLIFLLSLLFRYADREEWTDQEVRAGLTDYKEKGFVAANQVRFAFLSPLPLHFHLN